MKLTDQSHLPEVLAGIPPRLLERRPDIGGAKLAREEMVRTYQQTIQEAFRYVSASLIGYQRNRQYRERQEELVVAAQDAARISELRYRGGATSYLEVLTNETNACNAELSLTQAQLNELVSLVDIYRNLGGGWDSEELVVMDRRFGG